MKPAVPDRRTLRQRIAEAELQRLARTDPVLRIAMSRRCNRGPDCKRGPFDCPCQSREELPGRDWHIVGR